MQVSGSKDRNSFTQYIFIRRSQGSLKGYKQVCEFRHTSAEYNTINKVSPTVSTEFTEAEFTKMVVTNFWQSL